MRRNKYVGSIPKRVVLGQRLGICNIQGGTLDVFLFQRSNESFLVDDRPTCNVDDIGALWVGFV